MTGHDGHDGPDRQRDDALRALLASIDPTRPGGPGSTTADLTADQLRERIMATTDQSTTDQPTTDQPTTDQPTTEDRHGREDGQASQRAGRSRWLAAAAALVLVSAGVAAALAVRDADRTVIDLPPAHVALTLPGGDSTVSSSCVRFDVQLLRNMPVALAGTVTAMTDEQVTLRVNRWYHGTLGQRQADVVTLEVPGATTSAALDGVQFSTGKPYLLAATGGTVNGCGFSGPADPQLEAAYDEAFGG